MRVLQLLHMDLFGHITPVSVNGRKYSLVEVDDYSCFTWAIFLFIWKVTLSKLPKLLKQISINQSYFHIFGCRCFVHNIRKSKLKAFDNKANSRIFLGCSTVSTTYNVFNFLTFIVEETPRIVFDETPFNVSSQEQVQSAENAPSHEPTSKARLIPLVPNILNWDSLESESEEDVESGNAEINKPIPTVVDPTPLTIGNEEDQSYSRPNEDQSSDQSDEDGEVQNQRKTFLKDHSPCIVIGDPSKGV